MYLAKPDFVIREASHSQKAHSSLCVCDVTSSFATSTRKIVERANNIEVLNISAPLEYTAILWLIPLTKNISDLLWSCCPTAKSMSTSLRRKRSSGSNLTAALSHDLNWVDQALPLRSDRIIHPGIAIRREEVVYGSARR